MRLVTHYIRHVALQVNQSLYPDVNNVDRLLYLRLREPLAKTLSEPFLPISPAVGLYARA